MLCMSVISVDSRAGKTLRVRLNTAADRYQEIFICKQTLDTCVQMLHTKEETCLLKTDTLRMSMANVKDNLFCLKCCVLTDGSAAVCLQWQASIDPARIVFQLDNLEQHNLDISVYRLVKYVHSQLLPMHSNCAVVATQMQTAFGGIALPMTKIMHKGVDDAFLQSNACTISKLTDLLNHAARLRLTAVSTSLLKPRIKPPAACDEQQTESHSHSHLFAARLAWLGAVYCATAPAHRDPVLLHVSQMQATGMSHAFAEHMYASAPQKQHVTLLMRGDDAQRRIGRYNLTVRVFEPESDFVKELMPHVMGLNTAIASAVMIVTGVRNNQAAAIYLSSDTLSTDMHRSAMHTFFAGL